MVQVMRAWERGHAAVRSRFDDRASYVPIRIQSGLAHHSSIFYWQVKFLTAKGIEIGFKEVYLGLSGLQHSVNKLFDRFLRQARTSSISYLHYLHTILCGFIAFNELPPDS